VELSISDKKRRMFLRFKPLGVLMIFVGIVAISIFLAINSELREAHVSNVLRIFLLLISTVIVIRIFIASNNLFKMAYEAKKQHVYIGKNVIFIITSYIKTTSVGVNMPLAEDDVNTIYVISKKCELKEKLFKLKFKGENLIKYIERGENSEYWKQIVANGFNDGIKDVKGSYLTRTSIIKIFDDEDEQKLIDYFKKD
jgi:hypothetical protein